VTGRQNNNSLPERGESIDGPVYAAKCPLQRITLKNNYGTGLTRAAYDGRSMLGMTEEKKARRM
jgi:hypothetical protein